MIKYFSTSLWDISVKDIKGKSLKMSQFNESTKKAFILINVATKCGLTSSNYTQLVDLYEEYKDEGLEIIAFPSNSFKQELESTEDIEQVVKKVFNVKFPLMELCEVNGENAHPVFKYLIENSDVQDKDGNKKIPWNFTKFLVNKKGKIVSYYPPTMKPLDMLPEIEKMIQENNDKI